MSKYQREKKTMGRESPDEGGNSVLQVVHGMDSSTAKILSKDLQVEPREHLWEEHPKGRDQQEGKALKQQLTLYVH